MTTTRCHLSETYPERDHANDETDGPRDCCGVFGIYGEGVDIARTSFYGIYALQHRGQESAGIATSDGRSVHLHRGMGRVNQVFAPDSLAKLEGHMGIGHTRYSTTGSSAFRNAQPYVLETVWGPIAVAHNGNLTNHGQLRDMLLARGVGLVSSSDTELIIQLLAAPPQGGEARGADWGARIDNFMSVAEGAYSLVVLTRDAIFGIRDPLGMRPLCLGELETETGAHPVIASESCAFGTIGARFIRDVEPGEVVRLDQDGITTVREPQNDQRALCIFEYVYLARPDSLLEGQMIHWVRQETGRLLWEEAPVEADVVVGVPDSAIAAAIGYSRASGIPYDEGLMKNRYVGRTFIQPSDRLRKLGVTMKYNPLYSALEGKRVVLVDDSIVRGNTAGPLVKLLREGGATEVHVRVASPPVRHPCYMGVDMATREELIASNLDVESIREHVGADSLAYLSFQSLVKAAGSSENAYCHACFSGRYPLEVSDEAARAAEDSNETIVERSRR